MLHIPEFTIGENKILQVVLRTACAKHKVPTGISCHVIEPSVAGGSVYLAVCNHRAKKAGFIGQISPDALRKSKPKKK